MRQLIFVLFLLASLPATMARAEPYAQYNPATGDIRFLESDKVWVVYIGSVSGLNLHPAIRSLPLETTPVGVTDFQIAPTLRGVQYINPSGRGLPFTSLLVRGAFLPGTPISDVRYVDTFDPNRSYRDGRVVEVPEPSTLAAGTMSFLALAARRRRK
jgi:hypothetical protein